MLTQFNITYSKSKIPCLWESGGGKSNTGESMLIADSQGLPKKPIYICRKGHLSCSSHALIPIQIDDLIIRASHHREDFFVVIFKIKKFDHKNQKAICEAINCFSMNQWDEHLDKYLEKVVECAKNKATTYHCRTAMYIKEIQS